MSLRSALAEPVPLTTILPRPEAVISRRITISSSASTPASHSRSTKASGIGSISKPASTTAVSSPVLSISVEAREPSTRPSASIRIDLPAPVSPVIRLRPGSKSTSSRSITAMF